jgi:hypothetical protein
MDLNLNEWLKSAVDSDSDLDLELRDCAVAKQVGQSIVS